MPPWLFVPRTRSRDAVRPDDFSLRAVSLRARGTARHFVETGERGKAGGGRRSWMPFPGSGSSSRIDGSESMASGGGKGRAVGSLWAEGQGPRQTSGPSASRGLLELWEVISAADVVVSSLAAAFQLNDAKEAVVVQGTRGPRKRISEAEAPFHRGDLSEPFSH